MVNALKLINYKGKVDEVRTVKDMCLMFKKEEEKESPWIIDSGCSTHMTGSKRKFISLQSHGGGLIIFSGGTKGHIIGHGQIKLNQKTLIINVILVKDLKFDLLSV